MCPPSDTTSTVPSAAATGPYSRISLPRAPGSPPSSGWDRKPYAIVGDGDPSAGRLEWPLSGQSSCTAARVLHDRRSLLSSSQAPLDQPHAAARVVFRDDVTSSVRPAYLDGWLLQDRLARPNQLGGAPTALVEVQVHLGSTASGSHGSPDLLSRRQGSRGRRLCRPAVRGRYRAAPSRAQDSQSLRGWQR
jgi:hypothetical protein